MFYFCVINLKCFTSVAIMMRLFFSHDISHSMLIYHVYALVLLNYAIYVNLAWNCLTETLAFPSSFSGNIKESHFPFACLPTHLLLCPGKEKVYQVSVIPTQHLFWYFLLNKWVKHGIISPKQDSHRLHYLKALKHKHDKSTVIEKCCGKKKGAT